MKETILKNKRHLLVQIADDAIKIKVFNTCYCYCVLNDDMERVIDFDDMESEKHLVGTLSDILKDEDVCKGLVESYDYQKNIPHNPNIDYVRYKEYTCDFKDEELFDISKAKGSFLSYLKSINLDLSKKYILIKIN